jgi:hypothetical protein
VELFLSADGTLRGGVTPPIGMGIGGVTPPIGMGIGGVIPPIGMGIGGVAPPIGMGIGGVTPPIGMGIGEVTPPIIGIGGATPPVGMGAFAEPVAWPSNVLVKRLIKKNMERIFSRTSPLLGLGIPSQACWVTDFPITRPTRLPQDDQRLGSPSLPRPAIGDSGGSYRPSHYP